MSQSVSHHPGLSLLELYCDGSLTAEIAVLVATHLEYCPHCQQLRHDIEADQAWQISQSEVLEASGELWQQMLQQITQSTEPEQKAAQPLRLADSVISVGEYQFKLPRSLQHLAAKRSKWLNIGGIASCKLPSGEPHHLSLLLIDKNTEVPLHTHHGLEMTLVLSGEIVDEAGRYVPGDLIINTPDETHKPRNISDEPCLCLSVLSAPLHFKEGMTRWLNPLQKFFY